MVSFADHFVKLVGCKYPTKWTVEFNNSPILWEKNGTPILIPIIRKPHIWSSSDQGADRKYFRCGSDQTHMFPCAPSTHSSQNQRKHKQSSTSCVTRNGAPNPLKSHSACQKVIDERNSGTSQFFTGSALLSTHPVSRLRAQNTPTTQKGAAHELGVGKSRPHDLRTSQG